MLEVAATYASAKAAHKDHAKREVLHIPSLDGLRAVSFFIVFVAHAGLDRIVPGGFGVTVFFFLSGYLITTLMRREVERTGHVNIRNFYARRVLRILPPFYVVLLGAVALSLAGALGPVRLATGPVLAQALHFSNYLIALRGWSGVSPGTGVYWSLAVEEHFYLIFPAAFLLLHRLALTGKQMAIVFWAACGAVLLWRCALVLLLHANVDRTYLCSDTRIDSILFGCALAVWNNPVCGDLGPDPRRHLYWGRFLFPAGVFVLFVTFVVRDPVFRETARYTLQGIALTPIFVSAIVWPEWGAFRPLNWRTARFTGGLSYSMYLLHQVILAGVLANTRLAPFGRAVVALGMTYAAAWLMFRYVEAPCARLRKRFFSGE